MIHRFEQNHDALVSSYLPSFVSTEAYERWLAALRIKSEGAWTNADAAFFWVYSEGNCLIGCYTEGYAWLPGGLAVSPLFNPEPVWRQVRQPVLLMYGEVNWLVDPVESPALIGTALERGGNTNYTIATFERGDHNIRVTETGTPSEILRDIRYAPGYFQAKPDWV
jgi:hypothetical protein